MVTPRPYGEEAMPSKKSKKEKQAGYTNDDELTPYTE